MRNPSSARFQRALEQGNAGYSAYRLASGKITLDKLLIDDSHLLAVRLLSLREQASSHKPCCDNVEVTAARGMKSHPLLVRRQPVHGNRDAIAHKGMKPRVQSYLTNAGKRRNARNQILEELNATGRVGIARFGERHAHGEHTVRLKADIDTLQFEEDAHHQGCPGEQHNGQTDLRHHQHPSGACLPSCAA